MTTPNPEPQTVRPSFFTTLTNYLLVSGLLACVAFGVMQLGAFVIPTWHFAPVPVLCFLVALESAYMTRYLRYHTPPVPWYLLRGFEAVVIFLMMRSLLGVLRGPLFELGPQAGGIDNELVILAVLILLVWLASRSLIGDLLNLELIDPDFDRDIAAAIAETQVTSQHNLISFTSIAGVVLVFLLAITTGLARSSTPVGLAASYSLWPALIYFLLALILFSRNRLSLLRAGWAWEKIAVGQGVGGRWLAYTLVLLALAILIAVLLPTRYSLSLLDTLGYIFNVVFGLIAILVYLVAAVLYVLLKAFFPAGQLQSPQLPAMPFRLPPAANTLAPPTISEFVQSLIFWLIFFVATAYIAAQFLHRHPEISNVLKRLPGIGLLLRMWRKVRTWFGGLSQQLADLRESRRLARRPASSRSIEAARRFINPRKLSPRQQVQFFYLAMLRRSSERGYPRQATQTPNEFSRTLHSQLPEVSKDIAAITDEFSEARYSRHNITADRVSLVRYYWAHIKRALRR